jgi:uncharacterized protein (UPF0332 family)
MGSFNKICQLSGEVISPNDEVVAIPMFQAGSVRAPTSSTWGFFSPIPMILEGKYNSYGGLKETKVFDSLGKLNVEEKESLNKELLNYIKNNFDINKNNPNEEYSLNDVFYSEFIHRSINVLLVESVLGIRKNIRKTETEEIIKSFEEQMLSTLKSIGLKNFDEAEKFYEECKYNKKTSPIYFVMFHKNKFQYLLENYGNDFDKNNINEDDDIYATFLQKVRQNLVSCKETVDIINGSDYAGANNPKFNWKSVKENADTKNKGLIHKICNEQSIDVSIINDYFHLLGKIWTPSISVSEDIKYYGQDKAQEMQKLLVNNQEEKKSVNKRKIK